MFEAAGRREIAGRALDAVLWFVTAGINNPLPEGGVVEDNMKSVEAVACDCFIHEL